MDILDSYVLSSPNNQHVLDIFKGEWSSTLPEKFNLVTKPGTARLFEDSRVTWAEETIGKFVNLKILELGPLEGGHSYMFQNAGAQKVIAVEANMRAFLKCLCIKELLQLDKVEFKLGDFISFLKKEVSTYDLVFASGVLYHMEEPVELIKMISRVSDKTFIWTHYHDEKIISKGHHLSKKFSRIRLLEYEGVSYEYSTQSYEKALNWAGFCGGPKPFSKWLSRNSILTALRRYGFVNIQINFDDPDHPNGPAFAICATK